MADLARLEELRRQYQQGDDREAEEAADTVMLYLPALLAVARAAQHLYTSMRQGGYATLDELGDALAALEPAADGGEGE